MARERGLKVEPCPLTLLGPTSARGWTGRERSQSLGPPRPQHPVPGRQSRFASGSRGEQDDLRSRRAGPVDRGGLGDAGRTRRAVRSERDCATVPDVSKQRAWLPARVGVEWAKAEHSRMDLADPSGGGGVVDRGHRSRQAAEKEGSDQKALVPADEDHGSPLQGRQGMLLAFQRPVHAREASADGGRDALGGALHEPFTGTGKTGRERLPDAAKLSLPQRLVTHGVLDCGCACDGSRRALCRAAAEGYSSVGRASVSKTEGRGFESPCPCHAESRMCKAYARGVHPVCVRRAPHLLAEGVPVPAHLNRRGGRRRCAARRDDP